MSSRKQHCEHTKKVFGEEFDYVHIWLDGLANAGNGYMDVNHRIHRHNKEGVKEVERLWGKTAAKVAKLHIMDDCGYIATKKDMIAAYGEKPILRKWQDIFKK